MGELLDQLMNGSIRTIGWNELRVSPRNLGRAAMAAALRLSAGPIIGLPRTPIIALLAELAKNVLSEKIEVEKVGRWLSPSVSWNVTVASMIRDNISIEDRDVILDSGNKGHEIEIRISWEIVTIRVTFQKHRTFSEDDQLIIEEVGVRRVPITEINMNIEEVKDEFEKEGLSQESMEKVLEEPDLDEDLED